MDDKKYDVDGIEWLVREIDIPSYAGKGKWKNQHTKRNNYKFCQDPEKYMTEKGYTQLEDTASDYAGPAYNFIKSFNGTDVVLVNVQEIHDTLIRPAPVPRGVIACFEIPETGNLARNSGRELRLQGNEQDVLKVWKELNLKDSYQSTVYLANRGKL